MESVMTANLIKSLIVDQDEIIKVAQKRKAQLALALVKLSNGEPVKTGVKPRGKNRNANIRSSIIKVIGTGTKTREQIVAALQKKFKRHTQEELRTLANTVSWNLSHFSKKGGSFIMVNDPNSAVKKYKVRLMEP